MNVLNNIVAVIRTYSNPKVTKQVVSLLNFLSKVIVVVNEEVDRGSTREWLAKFQGDPRVTILSITEGYTWTEALNQARQQIVLENNLRRVIGGKPYTIMFPVSVEAQFRADHVEQMSILFEDNAIGVVGTTFEGMLNKNKVSLGNSYKHPRNTGMMIRLSVFDQPGMGLFDGFCNGVGGMEDLMFTMQMVAMTNFQFTMVNQRVPLIVGVHYNQESKEEREYQAMCHVVERLLKHAVNIAETVRAMDVLRAEDLEAIERMTVRK